MSKGKNRDVSKERELVKVARSNKASAEALEAQLQKAATVGTFFIRLVQEFAEGTQKVVAIHEKTSIGLCAICKVPSPCKTERELTTLVDGIASKLSRALSGLDGRTAPDPVEDVPGSVS